MSQLPVFVKGIQAPADAEAAIAAGADGIWVSNHGGRQLDGGPASFECLPKVAEAVHKRVPIVFDSGVRRGEHVFKGKRKINQCIEKAPDLCYPFFISLRL